MYLLTELYILLFLTHAKVESLFLHLVPNASYGSLLLVGTLCCWDANYAGSPVFEWTRLWGHLAMHRSYALVYTDFFKGLFQELLQWWDLSSCFFQWVKNQLRVRSGGYGINTPSSLYSFGHLSKNLSLREWIKWSFQAVESKYKLHREVDILKCHRVYIWVLFGHWQC